MKKQQMILLGSGVLLFCLVYFFGRTIPPQKPAGEVSATPAGADTLDTRQVMAEVKKNLTPSQQALVSRLEAAVVRGDVKDQQIKVFNQLAAFWRDSAHLLLPYSYYIGEAAKLENSEKNLTFAAHNFLEGVRQQPDPALKRWMAVQARSLYEKALEINPDNDSSKVGLGSCYLFGNISPMPMKGILMIREVAERDSSNMYAQFMLGMGGMESGQFDKAIERLSRVVKHEPDNVEAILNLAEAYERSGDKHNAIRWYEASRRFFEGTDILKEIDGRIAQLKS